MMTLPPTGQMLSEIEQQQDFVLRELETLDQELERTLLAYQRELKVFHPPAEARDSSMRSLAPVEMAALVDGA
jgi:hypothetical protein